MQDKRCAYCGRVVGHDPLGPDTFDTKGWVRVQAEHAPDCRWAWSRAFKSPTMPDRGQEQDA